MKGDLQGKKKGESTGPPPAQPSTKNSISINIRHQQISVPVPNPQYSGIQNTATVDSKGKAKATWVPKTASQPTLKIKLRTQPSSAASSIGDISTGSLVIKNKADSPAKSARELEQNLGPVRKKLFLGPDPELSAQREKGSPSKQFDKELGTPKKDLATSHQPPPSLPKQTAKEQPRRSSRNIKPPTLFSGFIPTPTKKTRIKTSEAKTEVKNSVREAGVLKILREEDTAVKELSKEQIRAIDELCGTKPPSLLADTHTEDPQGHADPEWSGMEEGEFTLNDEDLMETDDHEAKLGTENLDVNVDDYVEFDMELNPENLEEEDEDLLDEILNEDVLGAQDASQRSEDCHGEEEDLQDDKSDLRAVE